jgi:hypothetical protein
MTRRDAKHVRAISSSICELPAVSELQQAQIHELDDFAVSLLLSFFKLLDRWDREVEHNAEIM